MIVLILYLTTGA